VPRHTPGWEYGFNVDDEILAIDDYRIRPEQWDARLEQYCPGDQASVLLARRDRLLRLNVTFAAEPPRGWKLAVHPEATEAQRARFTGWLQTCGVQNAPGGA
jgi:predicted metalloprotease with PDZ domain